jgi:hypothetical protein
MRLSLRRRRSQHKRHAVADGMKRRLIAEALGSFFLFATVVGSGIMAERLAK